MVYLRSRCWVRTEVNTSLGTVLGATFATMFPDRVERIALDGVLYVQTIAEPFSVNMLEDTDKVYGMFFRYCIRAGPSQCAFAREGDDVDKLRSRTEGVLRSLREHPLVGVHPATNTPSIITWDTVQAATFGMLYSPELLFPLLAVIYDLLYRKEFEVLHASMPQLHSRSDPQTYCSTRLPTSFDSGDAQTAIRCADQRNYDRTIRKLEQRFDEMAIVSSFADVMINVDLPCNGWKISSAIQPKPLFDSEMAINASFPLLFISNSFDPITPLRNGVNMARKFTDAGLVEQEGEGH